LYISSIHTNLKHHQNTQCNIATQLQQQRHTLLQALSNYRSFQVSRLITLMSYPCQITISKAPEPRLKLKYAHTTDSFCTEDIDSVYMHPKTHNHFIIEVKGKALSFKADQAFSVVTQLRQFLLIAEVN